MVLHQCHHAAPSLLCWDPELISVRFCPSNSLLLWQRGITALPRLLRGTGLPFGFLRSLEAIRLLCISEEVNKGEERALPL